MKNITLEYSTPVNECFSIDFESFSEKYDEIKDTVLEYLFEYLHRIDPSLYTAERREDFTHACDVDLVVEANLNFSGQVTYPAFSQKALTVHNSASKPIVMNEISIAFFSGDIEDHNQ